MLDKQEKNTSNSKNSAQSNPKPDLVDRSKGHPSGTVTFLFTDIEGSTRLWEQFPKGMQAAFSRQESLMRQTMTRHGGYIYKMIGDAFQVAFDRAEVALKAALDAQSALSIEDWGVISAIKVRMAIHTGVTEERGDDYVGPTLNRVARILGAGHGGQVLLSQTTYNLVRESLPEGMTVLDLGEYRLKDLTRPEHIFQLLGEGVPHDFPRLTTLDIHPNNLPVQLTSFIGRDAELREVLSLLESTRLLTLTGVGGTGKTRLALQLAAELLDNYEHGVWLVELAPLSDDRYILPTVMAIFNLRQEPGMELIKTLINYLQSKHLLLLLDNCEHLVAEVARLTEIILRSTPLIKILASSREGLGVAGETIYNVPSLATPKIEELPSLEILDQYDAIRLFRERAGATQPAFTLSTVNARAVVQICSRLDGIPLAIELAAARVKVLSVEQIAARLDDRFRLLTGGSRTAMPRHQTLRALIDWSYGLLMENERVLFRRLSVFMGGLTLEAAEVVCACEPIDESEVLDLLEGLVNKSLLVTEELEVIGYRYRMLETIRQYALEKLFEAEETVKLRDRHLEYMTGFTEKKGDELRGSGQYLALRHLDSEHDNLRAALGWSLGGDQYIYDQDNAMDEKWQSMTFDMGLRILCALWLYWSLLQLTTEAKAWYKKALVGLERDYTISKTRKAQVYYSSAWFANDMLETRTLLDKSRELYLASGDRLGYAMSMSALGETMAYYDPLLPTTVDITTGLLQIDESITVLRQLNERWLLAMALMNKALIYLAQKKYMDARSNCEEAIELMSQIGGEFNSNYGVVTLGLIAAHQGDFATAKECYQRSLKMMPWIKSRIDLLGFLGNLSRMAYKLADYPQMEIFTREALENAQNKGNIVAIIYYQRRLGLALVHQEKMVEALEWFNKSLDSAQEARDEYGIVAYVLYTAMLAVRLGKNNLATRLLGAIESLLEKLYKPFDLEDQEEYEKLTERVREEIKLMKRVREFKTAWKRGRELTSAEAIQLVKSQIQVT